MQKLIFLCLYLITFQVWSGTGCLTWDDKICYPQVSAHCDCKPLPDDKKESLKTKIKKFFNGIFSPHQ